MDKILDLLRVEHQFEHHLRKNKKHFSIPKIYTGGANLDTSKRWYVYYKYRNPQTDKLERQQNIYLLNQSEKDVKTRLKELKLLQKNLLMLLHQGHSPYPNAKDTYTVKSALTWALEIKQKSLTATTAGDYEQKLSQFLRWCAAKGLDFQNIEDLQRRHVLEYLNELVNYPRA
ncbi:MAG: phage integrase N-terminal SAM-like domain-containing protein [Weeksellaceae bacterium]|nr:phage integrase N-terminal SAM-like domain-containing protein [Weeksellaceae bacterium]